MKGPRFLSNRSNSVPEEPKYTRSKTHPLSGIQIRISRWADEDVRLSAEGAGSPQPVLLLLYRRDGFLLFQPPAAIGFALRTRDLVVVFLGPRVLEFVPAAEAFEVGHGVDSFRYGADEDICRPRTWAGTGACPYTNSRFIRRQRWIPLWPLFSLFSSPALRSGL